MLVRWTRGPKATRPRLPAPALPQACGTSNRRHTAFSRFLSRAATPGCRLLPARAPRSPEPHLRRSRVGSAGLDSKRVRSCSTPRLRGETIRCVPLRFTPECHAPVRSCTFHVPRQRPAASHALDPHARCVSRCSTANRCFSLVESRSPAPRVHPAPDARSRARLSLRGVPHFTVRPRLGGLSGVQRRGVVVPRPADQSSLGSSVIPRSARPLGEERARDRDRFPGMPREGPTASTIQTTFCGKRSFADRSPTADARDAPFAGSRRPVHPFRSYIPGHAPQRRFPGIAAESLLEMRVALATFLHSTRPAGSHTRERSSSRRRCLDSHPRSSARRSLSAAFAKGAGKPREPRSDEPLCPPREEPALRAERREARTSARLMARGGSPAPWTLGRPAFVTYEPPRREGVPPSPTFARRLAEARGSVAFAVAAEAHLQPPSREGRRRASAPQVPFTVRQRHGSSDCAVAQPSLRPPST